MRYMACSTPATMQPLTTPAGTEQLEAVLCVLSVHVVKLSEKIDHNKLCNSGLCSNAV